MYVFSLVGGGGGLCHLLRYYAQMPPSTLARLKLARLSQVERRGGRNQETRATGGNLKWTHLVLSSPPRESIKQHTQYFTPPGTRAWMCVVVAHLSTMWQHAGENGPWSRYASVIMRLREYSRKRRRNFNQDIKQTLRERLYTVERIIFN